MWKYTVAALSALTCVQASSQLLRVQFDKDNTELVSRMIQMIDDAQLDLWSEESEGSKVLLNIAVDERAKREFSRLLEKDVEYSVMIDDLEAVAEAERKRMAMRSNNTEFFEEYRTYEEIASFVDQTVAKYNFTEKIVVGRSYEGRDIMGIVIGKGSSTKKQIFYNGGIHAREWISPATVTYIIKELTEKYDVDTEVTRMVDEIEWTIVPVLNPDGYVYTHLSSSNRFWRKNRVPNQGSLCVGTDLNRNWPFQWNTGGSSNSPCSDSYHGSGPSSAPETAAAQAYIKSMRNLRGYIDFHAYSQYWMLPYGYTCNLPKPEDYDRQYAMGKAATAALTNVYGTRYTVGSICNIIYPASGSSVDFVYGELGVLHSIGIELRDTGRYGFTLPAEQIVPSGIETFEAVKVMADTIIKEN